MLTNYSHAFPQVYQINEFFYIITIVLSILLFCVSCILIINNHTEDYTLVELPSVPQGTSVQALNIMESYPAQSVVEASISSDLPTFATYLGDLAIHSITILFLLVISGGLLYYLHNKVKTMKTSENDNGGKKAFYQFAFYFMTLVTSYIFLSFIGNYASLCENCQELARLYSK